jgi:hypothetical protein
MREAQEESIMEKQPNSRMCFVCGIDNPIGLHLHFYTDDEGHRAHMMHWISFQLRCVFMVQRPFLCLLPPPTTA